MRVGLIFLSSGICLLAAILGLFWLKDHLQNQTLGRLAYSEPIARLAVVGAALVIIGLLLIVSSLWS